MMNLDELVVKTMLNGFVEKHQMLLKTQTMWESVGRWRSCYRLCCESGGTMEVL